MKNNRSCLTCHHYQERLDDHMFGECRINPPVIVGPVLEGLRNQDDGSDWWDDREFATMWPTVGDGAWCSHYKSMCGDSSPRSVPDA